MALETFIQQAKRWEAEKKSRSSNIKQLKRKNLQNIEGRLSGFL